MRQDHPGDRAVTRNHLRDALTVSVVAVAWSLVSGAAAVAVGVRTSSTALVGTGADVLADMVSSVVLVWRFRVELHGGRPGVAVERRAHAVAATALLVVAVGVATGSIVRLASGHGASPDALGVVIASASLVVLPLLAVVKLRIARAIPSRALHTDAIISLVGAATAALSLLGLALTESLNWTAADPAAALGIAALAAVTSLRELRNLPAQG